MATKILDPLQAAQNGDFSPVYALDGEERLLVDEAIVKIRDAAVAAHARDFNLDVYNGKNVDLTRVVATLTTLPAFSPRRVVILEAADKLDLEKVDVLLSYFEKPSTSSVLILVAERFDARTKFYKTLQKMGRTLRFERLKAKDMPEAIRQRARLREIRIDQNAAYVLADTVGADLAAADKALEMLRLYVGHERPIGKDDIAALLPVSKQESIFVLVDAIGSRQRARIWECLQSVMGPGGEHPLRVLAMIVRHFRQLLRAKAILTTGGTKYDVQSAVGVPPFLIDKLVQQANQHSLSGLLQNLQVIRETDRGLKGGKLRPERYIERLVVRLLAE